MSSGDALEQVAPRRHARRRRWATGAAVILLTYLVFALVLAFGGCVDRMVLYPRAFDANPDGAVRKLIPYDGGQLELWTGQATGTTQPAAYVLTFHGNGDSADNALAGDSHFWAGQPVEIWAMNFPGYGRSTGPATLARLGPAGLAAFDALHQHAAGKPIIVSGNSMGTTIALHVAGSRDVAGVILRDPPALRQIIVGEHGWWNLWLAAAPLAMGVPASLDSLANARAANAPAVFIFNTGDTVVPYEYQRSIQDAYAGSKRPVVLAGNHNEVPDGALEAIRTELAQLLRQVTPP